MITDRDELTTLANIIQEMDFDHTFTLTEDGVIGESTKYAPAVYSDPNGDILIESNNWKPMTGKTGQYSYNGAIMHPSEQIGWGPAISGWMIEQCEDMDTPQTFVFTSVEVECDDECGGAEDRDKCEDFGDHFPAGWCVLHYVGKN